MSRVSMKNNRRSYLLVRSLLLLIISASPAISANKYGFVSDIRRCSLWDTFFPLSSQVPNDKATRNADPRFNIFYITGTRVKHMDDYTDLYYPGGVRVWPQSPYLTPGQNTAICQNAGECVTPGRGSVGKGISAYNNLKSEFPNDTIKVGTGSAYDDGDITWGFLATRKLKLLRSEYFTPYTGTDSVHVGYVEPLYFEYRETGNGDEMQLVAMGGTARNGDFSRVKLPQKIKLTALSAIQIWLVREGDGAYQDLLPAAGVVYFTSSQMALIPENCR